MEIVNPIKSAEQIKQMKDVLMQGSYRNFMLFELGINTGLRVSDLLHLKVKDVKGTHLEIREGKTKKSKVFYIEHLQDVIAPYIQGKDDEAYLFPSRKGDKPISRVQAYTILNNAAEVVGIEKVGTHTLRKTFGYWYYEKTSNLTYLMKIFNHSSQGMTLRYIGIEQENIDDSMKGFRI